MDQSGNPIWFRQSDKHTQNRDFKVQYYFGHPVLTLWQGTIAGTLSANPIRPQGEPLPGGHFQIINQHYQVIRTITAKEGYTADNHEFLITKRNTALFLAIKLIPANLAQYGAQGMDILEIILFRKSTPQTDKLIFFWDALSHINPVYSNVPASSAMEVHHTWDPFHLNSVEDGPNDTLLVSMRDMWSIYNINKKTGNIIWQLGGKQSDFTFGPNATFSWQHDARYRSKTKISLFDNDCCKSPTSPPEGASHGLIVDLDYKNMTVTGYRTYYHNPDLYVDHQGNMQQLPNCNQFIGWGVKHNLSEFKYGGNTKETPSKNLIYSMQMPNHTYRAFKHEWVGLPLDPPDVAIGLSHNGKAIVCASWNGSTETTAWQVLAGLTPYTMLNTVPCAPRTGFETAIYTDVNGPYFQVNALDSYGVIIGQSRLTVGL